MKFRPLVLLLSLLFLMATSVFAAKKPAPAKGAANGKAQKRVLPQPSLTKVMVMPFEDFGNDLKRKRAATASAFLLFEHEGFQMVPLRDVEKAIAQDKQIKSGKEIQIGDIARIGKAVGAKWVVCGDVKRMREVRDRGPRGDTLNKEIVMVLDVFECDTLKDIAGGSLRSWLEIEAAKPGSLLANIQMIISIQGDVGSLLSGLFADLPKHKQVANIPGETSKHVPTPEDTYYFMERTWSHSLDEKSAG